MKGEPLSPGYVDSGSSGGRLWAMKGEPLSTGVVKTEGFYIPNLRSASGLSPEGLLTFTGSFSVGGTSAPLKEQSSSPGIASKGLFS